VLQQFWNGAEARYSEKGGNEAIAYPLHFLRINMSPAIYGTVYPVISAHPLNTTYKKNVGYWEDIAKVDIPENELLNFIEVFKEIQTKDSNAHYIDCVWKELAGAFNSYEDQLL
jgi:hypothetical protein